MRNLYLLGQALRFTAIIVALVLTLVLKPHRYKLMAYLTIPVIILEIASMVILWLRLYIAFRY
jgi:hypothetical protein